MKAVNVDFGQNERISEVLLLENFTKCKFCPILTIEICTGSHLFRKEMLKFAVHKIGLFYG